jgi:hypothetical protein
MRCAALAKVANVGVKLGGCRASRVEPQAPRLLSVERHMHLQGREFGRCTLLI